jgi:hypothetical protein
MPTPQELADALDTRVSAIMTELRSRQGMAPTAESVARLQRLADSLSVGIDLANTALNAETDAGRLAMTEYRALTSSVDNASDVYGRVSVALATTVLPSGATPAAPGSTPARRRAGGWAPGPLGIMTIASVTVVGLAWFFSRKPKAA